MSFDLLRRRFAGVICLGIAAPVLTALGWGGQTPAGRTPAPNPPGLARYIYGARHCKGCHDQKNNPTYKAEELEGWICQMVEFDTFDKQDKHKLAFAALTGSRGQQMSKLLNTDVTKIEACLNCHSVPARVSESQSYTRETDGVTCVACHGAHAEWVEKHQRASKEWHDLDRKDKERRFGMTDLWDPVRRAETCASCHVGNFAQGKVVTHAMYAAGHPPLPGFETATFGDLQPRHWQYLREKTPERLSRLNRPDPHNLEQTQLVRISGLVVLRDWMTLFAEQASTSKPDPVGAQWPDFARFDCYACHHELQAKDGVSWRQVRRRDGHPGRPTAPEWPLILIQLGIQAANPEQAALRETQFKQHLAEFHESMKVRPFGDPEKVIPAARKTAAWANSLLKSMNQTTLDAAQARKLLEKLCTMARQSIPDYDSARQIAWAFRVIYRESTSKDKRDALIEHVLADLEADLALNLPSAAEQVPIEKTLPDRLRKIADFDPESFQAHFEMIAERIAPPAAIPPARR
ncbi:MAG: multiheme c-type cytochrome [Isosphaerales bacterium]